MHEPFWQRPVESLEYADVAAFIAEAIPEGDHVEYKLPTYNDQNGKVEFTPEFLETIVAFANTGEGLIICGVREDKKTKRPERVEGISQAREAKPRDLTIVLRDICREEIEPVVRLEARVLDIPKGEEGAGNKLMLIHVHRGSSPPYNLLRHGIFIRNGERDDRARVREIAALFNRHEAAAGVFGGDVRYRTVFSWAAEHQPDKPPILMVGIEPALPIEHMILTEQTDEVFRGVGIDLFHADYIVLEPHGIMYNPGEYGRDPEPGRFGSAYDDGTIGVQVSLAAITRDDLGGPHPLNTNVLGRNMDILVLWRTVRWVLEVAARWPRDACGYSRPLLCRLALGNLANVGLTLPPGWIHEPRPLARNRLPGWAGWVEWDKGTDLNDLLAAQFALLARHLQFPHYQTFRPRLREAAAREAGRPAWA